ncbi:MAG TPA: hypothetical protein VFB61_08280 [Gemmatimonadales bacterium]|nr:hypothetical protein [Gemmatimonadales bacterium]
MRRVLVFAMLLPTATSALAHAQDACADLPKFFSKPPKIGEWAEYTWQEKGKTESQRVRMAVVKEEQRQGKRMYWLQMSMNDKDPSKRTIIQTLMPWEVSTLGGQGSVEVVMKIGNQPAMKTGPEHAKAAGGADWREACKDSKFVAEESVTVPAGTFKARHYSGAKGEDTWASLEVPVWHMVKMSTKEGNTMALSATGMGAKSEITEQPQDISNMLERMKNQQGAPKP